MSRKYYCKKCDFMARDKRDYSRHCSSEKHKTMGYVCHRCNKNYKYRSGLSRHKCKFMWNEDENIIENTKIVKHEKNNGVEELLNIIKEQQKQLNESQQLIEKVIKETVPRIGNNNNNISINVYLNEKCKNAMNLTDFVDQINVSLEDLVYTQEHGYVEGITNIFKKQLNDLSPNERPIHCSDTKRLQFYVKDDNTWMKDEKHIKLDKSLKDVKMKQIKELKTWEDLNPGYLTDENLLTQLATSIPVKCALKNK